MSDDALKKINFTPLLKATAVFKSFLPNSSTEQLKAGTIQAFEFCYELLWKLMRKILLAKGLTTNSPRDTFRAAAATGLIEDPEIWFEVIEKRNLTVHTYNQKYINEIIAFLPSFEKELDKFIEKLKEFE